MAEMTLQEAFDAQTKGKDKAYVNNFRATLRDLEKAGFPPSTPVSELNTEKGITDLQRWATTERFVDAEGNVKVVGSGMFASRVKTLINTGIGPEDVNVLSNFEKANRGAKDAPRSEKEFGIRFTRAPRKLELPSFDDFNSAIDATARQLTDKEAKAFLMIKTLTGLRNPDIAQLQLGNAEKGAKYGSFDPAVKKLYSISNKGDRTNYDLGEIVHGILADLAEDAKAAGRTNLFTKDADQLRAIINPVMRANMDSMGLQIYNIGKEKVEPFSVRDLRKNIFDILEEEIGAGDANKVLGHSSAADVGLNHYKVERKSRKSLSRLQSAQEIFSNLYMESIGFDSPQTVFGNNGYGFSNDNFKPTTAVPFTVDKSPEQQLLETQSRTTTAQVSGAVDRSVDSLENKVKRLEGLIAQTQDLTQQAEGLTPVDDKAANKAAAKAADLDATKAGLLNNIAKVGRPVLKVVAPPVGFALSAIAADQTRSAVVNSALADQARDLGIPEGAIQTAGVVAGATEFLPVTPTDVIGATQAVASMEATVDPKSLETAAMAPRVVGREDFAGPRGPGFTAVPRDDFSPISIPAFPPTSSGMLEAANAKDRVNLATRAAEQGEETTMTGSFINQPM